jgi:hypothetical protein
LADIEAVAVLVCDQLAIDPERLHQTGMRAAHHQRFAQPRPTFASFGSTSGDRLTDMSLGAVEQGGDAWQCQQGQNRSVRS